jgi:hypothetical protein
LKYLLTKDATDVLVSSKCYDMFPKGILFAERNTRSLAENPKFIAEELNEPPEDDISIDGNDDYINILKSASSRSKKTYHNEAHRLREIAHKHGYTVMDICKKAAFAENPTDKGKLFESVWVFLTNIANSHSCEKVPQAPIAPPPLNCIKQKFIDIVKFSENQPFWLDVAYYSDYKAFKTTYGKSQSPLA